MTTSVFEKALRHDRALAVAALLLIVALSWAYLLAGAGIAGGPHDEQMVMAPEPWTPGYAAVMLLMWAVMMAAMMLPGAAPMLLLFVAITHKRGEARRLTASGMFALGYVAVWTVFSLAAVMLQFGLDSIALLSPTMRTSSIALAGAVLIGAGIYQWTPLKYTCLRHCRSPLEFVLTHWRVGLAGAFRMGCRHGLYCLGCCWMLMLLLFVGGVMNLFWISGLALFVLIEKLAPAGHWLGRGAGVVLVAWGIATLGGIQF